MPSIHYVCLRKDNIVPVVRFRADYRWGIELAFWEVKTSRQVASPRLNIAMNDNALSGSVSAVDPT